MGLNLPSFAELNTDKDAMGLILSFKNNVSYLLSRIEWIKNGKTFLTGLNELDLVTQALIKGLSS